MDQIFNILGSAAQLGECLNSKSVAEELTQFFTNLLEEMMTTQKIDSHINRIYTFFDDMFLNNTKLRACMIETQIKNYFLVEGKEENTLCK